MALARIIYYSTSYAAVLAGMAFALFYYVQWRHPADLWFLALMGSMSLTTAFMSFSYLLAYSESSSGASAVFNMFEVAGMIGLIASVPRFIACFVSHKGMAALKRASLAASLVLVPTVLVFVLPLDETYRTAVMWILTVLMASSAIYAIVALLFLRRSPNDPSNPDEARWSAILPPFVVTGAVMMPIAVANDIFFTIPSLIPRVFDMPKLVPLLAMAWTLIYVIRGFTARTTSTSGKTPGGLDWERFPLTVRERQVAELLIEGYTYRGIAQRLGVTEGTVKTHVLKVYEKTGAGNKIELLRFLAKP